MRKQDLDKAWIFRGTTYGPGDDIEVPDEFPKKPGTREDDVDHHPMGAHVTTDGISDTRSVVQAAAGEAIVGLNEVPKGSSGSGVALEHAVGAGIDIAAHGGQLPNTKVGDKAEKDAEKTHATNLKQANLDAKEADVKLSADAKKSQSHTVDQVK